MANEKWLIDANALLEKLSRMIDYCKTDKKVNATTALFQVGDAIMDCPTVDAVEVVHGRWIDDGGLDEDGNGQYRCSSCGVGEKHNPTVTVSYCWNCGAKMDGGNDDAER